MMLSIIVPFKSDTDPSRLIKYLLEGGKTNIHFIVVEDLVGNEGNQELESVTKKLRNVTLIRGNYGGPGLARNAGLMECSTDWIGFWDSDDEPDIQNYLSMVKHAASEKKRVAVGEYVAINEESRLETTGNSQKNFDSLYLNLGLWRICFHNSVISACNFPNLKMAEDQIFFANLQILPGDCYFSPLSVYRYFYGNSSHLTSNKKAILELRKARKLLLKQMKDSDPSLNLFTMFLKQTSTLFLRSNLLNKSYVTLALPVEIIILRPQWKIILNSLYRVIKGANG